MSTTLYGVLHVILEKIENLKNKTMVASDFFSDFFYRVLLKDSVGTIDIDSRTVEIIHIL